MEAAAAGGHHGVVQVGGVSCMSAAGRHHDVVRAGGVSWLHGGITMWPTCRAVQMYEAFLVAPHSVHPPVCTLPAVISSVLPCAAPVQDHPRPRCAGCWHEAYIQSPPIPGQPLCLKDPNQPVLKVVLYSLSVVLLRGTLPLALLNSFH